MLLCVACDVGLLTTTKQAITQDVLHGALTVELSHQGYSEALMRVLITHFLKASFIVGALSIGLSLPGIWLYRKRPGV